MFKKRTFLLCAVLAGICTISLASDLWTPPNKKIIDLSWASPDVDFLAKNLSRMEQEAPVDGIAVKFTGRSKGGKGKPISMTTGCMSKTRLKREDFQSQINTYKSLKFKRFTDNFFYTTVMPGDQDWFNDQDWQALCDNFSLIAKVAKECNMKGILFDPEEYGKKFWSYSSIKKPQKECSVIARKRGQEWGHAIFKEFPDIKLFVLYWLPAKKSYYADFINGVYDVIPPTATIIDGCETPGYHANSRWDFRCAKDVKEQDALTYLSRNNVQKYKAQTQFAPACYIDAILGINKKWATHLHPEINESAPRDFLTKVIYRALESSDEYIWLYSEKGAWWTGSKYPIWDKMVPGSVNALAGAKNPVVLDVRNHKNLIQNSSFDKEGGWVVWQHRISPRGYARWNNGYLDMCETNWGSIHQTINVKPKEIYIIRANIRYNKKYRGYAALEINYFNAVGQSVNSGRYDKFLKFDKSNKYQEWIPQAFLTEIPEGAVTMKIQLHIRQQGHGDFFSIDNFDCKKF